MEYAEKRNQVWIKLWLTRIVLEAYRETLVGGQGSL